MADNEQDKLLLTEIVDVLANIGTRCFNAGQDYRSNPINYQEKAQEILAKLKAMGYKSPKEVESAFNKGVKRGTTIRNDGWNTENHKRHGAKMVKAREEERENMVSEGYVKWDRTSPKLTKQEVGEFLKKELGYSDTAIGLMRDDIARYINKKVADQLKEILTGEV